MNIAMFTNFYRPMVGGVAISVERFAEGYRKRGHNVLVVAPNFPDQSQDETDVVRISAIQNFNGTDFSVALPPGPDLLQSLEEFEPDLIHSHHPFLLGDSAARVATHRNLPLVYTHHTMYEHYTHYVPGDSKVLRNFVVQLATRYAEMCNLVVAPSQSVEQILRDRGVSSQIAVVPTGVDLDKFSAGDGRRGRRKMGIDPGEFLIGHVGRLAEEKNLAFLSRALITAMRDIDARVLVVGSGDMDQRMREMFAEAGLSDRVIFAGTQTSEDLADLYAAMDVFAFASRSETQGMVLVEALSTGTPVVALDAPGAREVVRDRQNGRLVDTESEQTFADALAWMRYRTDEQTDRMADQARQDAGSFGIGRCVDEMLAAYEEVVGRAGPARRVDEMDWQGVLDSLRREWEIWSNRAASLTKALLKKNDPRHRRH